MHHKQFAKVKDLFIGPHGACSIMGITSQSLSLEIRELFWCLSYIINFCFVLVLLARTWKGDNMQLDLVCLIGTILFGLVWRNLLYIHHWVTLARLGLRASLWLLLGGGWLRARRAKEVYVFRLLSFLAIVDLGYDFGRLCAILVFHWAFCTHFIFKVCLMIASLFDWLFTVAKTQVFKSYILII